MNVPHLIDLDQDLPGQRRFISSWASIDGDPSYVVDPGPTGTIDVLARRLDELGCRRLDYVLLTHIHLDHGGGAARLLEHFPAARVVCMEKAAAHLIDPQRLWRGSLEVLGDFAEVYGEPGPVPSGSIAGAAEIEAHGFKVIPTPGHAPHHQCYVRGDVLFIGEAAGAGCALDGGRLYLRPATPPRFFLEESIASLDRLAALDPPPAVVAMGHHGLIEGRTAEVISVARSQLRRWTQAVREEDAAAPGVPQEDLFARIIARLQAEDPHFAPVDGLPSDIRGREIGFAGQSLRGMLGYVRGDGGASGRS